MAKRRALCTLGAGPHEELLELSSPTFERFADKHGYELHLSTVVPIPDRHPSWGRVLILKGLLVDYDEVLWIDADAVIVDDSADISAEAGIADLMAMVAHRTPEGDSPIPNCGVWFLRSDPATFAFLDRVWKAEHFIDHKWWENAAVLEQLGYVLEPKVHLTEPTPMWKRTCILSTQWNSIPVDPSPSPRIVHFPGMSHAERLAEMKRVIAELDRGQGG